MGPMPFLYVTIAPCLPGDRRRGAAGEARDDRVSAEVGLDVGPPGPRVHPARRRRVERGSGQAAEQQLRRGFDRRACQAKRGVMRIGSVKRTH